MNARTLVYLMIVLTLSPSLLTACSDLKVERTPEVVAPQPGISISASIATSEKASSGTLSFNVAEDGASIKNLRIGLKVANCDNVLTMGSVEDFISDPGISIADGQFSASLPAMGGMVENFNFNPGDTLPPRVDDPMSVGKIDGHFTAPNMANGTITIFLGVPFSGGIVCELGTFEWSAN